MAELPGPRLADAIDDLRRELADAMGRGDGERLRFQLGTVSMEFEVGIAATVGGEAGVRFWVVSAGATGERASTTTHRISLQLTPLMDGQPDPLISERHLETAPPATAAPTG
ncbi:hypothetical protein HZF07_22230 [Nocardioides sp. CGMCC 1.13656]|uniref:trypco2 family protein n=1 Tax=Nocardioides TaxID=1839 RepID=UPI0015EB899C|nr:MULTISPECIES: trypco2 family protein [unclassified Nocardioides]MBA2956452.1 hypothetical protein [Nocardioides sp. CGMCC 1.13656]